jgi:hypothetical protein
VNTEKWEGWTPYYDAGGPVFYNGMIQSYLNVRPKAAAEGAAPDGGGNIGLIVGLVAVAGVVVWWLARGRRRRDKAEED